MIQLYQVQLFFHTNRLDIDFGDNLWIRFLTKVSEHDSKYEHNSMYYQLRHFIFIAAFVVHGVTRGDVAVPKENV